MNESAKLAEAKYFLDRMIAERDLPESFQYNLHAFLSACQALLEYTKKEIGKDPDNKARARAWFERLAGKDEMVRFFEEKRNQHSHHRPVALTVTANTAIFDRAFISDAVAVSVRDADGNIVYQHESEAQRSSPQISDSFSTIAVEYKFDEKNEVIALCSDYLVKLDTLVTEGRSKGYLPG